MSTYKAQVNRYSFIHVSGLVISLMVKFRDFRMSILLGDLMVYAESIDRYYAMRKRLRWNEKGIMKDNPSGLVQIEREFLRLSGTW